MQHYTPLQLKERLEQDAARPVLLDVREPREFRTCALEDSRLIPMREIPARLQSLDKDDEIVVICHHGIRSRSVVQYMEQQGFTHVINLSGGLAAWAHDVDPDMPTY